MSQSHIIDRERSTGKLVFSTTGLAIPHTNRNLGVNHGRSYQPPSQPRLSLCGPPVEQKLEMSLCSLEIETDFMSWSPLWINSKSISSYFAQSQYAQVVAVRVSASKLEIYDIPFSLPMSEHIQSKDCALSLKQVRQLGKKYKIMEHIFNPKDSILFWTWVNQELFVFVVPSGVYTWSPKTSCEPPAKWFDLKLPISATLSSFQLSFDKDWVLMSGRQFPGAAGMPNEGSLLQFVWVHQSQSFVTEGFAGTFGEYSQDGTSCTLLLYCQMQRQSNNNTLSSNYQLVIRKAPGSPAEINFPSRYIPLGKRESPISLVYNSRHHFVYIVTKQGTLTMVDAVEGAILIHGLQTTADSYCVGLVSDPQSGGCLIMKSNRQVLRLAPAEGTGVESCFPREIAAQAQAIAAAALAKRSPGMVSPPLENGVAMKFSQLLASAAHGHGGGTAQVTEKLERAAQLAADEANGLRTLETLNHFKVLGAEARYFAALLRTGRPLKDFEAAAAVASLAAGDGFNAGAPHQIEFAERWAASGKLQWGPLTDQALVQAGQIELACRLALQAGKVTDTLKSHVCQAGPTATISMIHSVLEQRVGGSSPGGQGGGKARQAIPELVAALLEHRGLDAALPVAAQFCHAEEEGLLGPLVAAVERAGGPEAVWRLLRPLVDAARGPAVPLKYLEACARTGRHAEANRVCRDLPEALLPCAAARDLLLALPDLPDARPLMRVCHRGGFVGAMVAHLARRGRAAAVWAYATRVAPENAAAAVGALADLGGHEALVEALLRFAAGRVAAPAPAPAPAERASEPGPPGDAGAGPAAPFSGLRAEAAAAAGGRASLPAGAARAPPDWRSPSAPPRARPGLGGAGPVPGIAFAGVAPSGHAGPTRPAPPPAMNPRPAPLPLNPGHQPNSAVRQRADSFSPVLQGPSHQNYTRPHSSSFHIASPSNRVDPGFPPPGTNVLPQNVEGPVAVSMPAPSPQQQPGMPSSHTPWAFSDFSYSLPPTVPVRSQQNPNFSATLNEAVHPSLTRNNQPTVASHDERIPSGAAGAPALLANLPVHAHPSASPPTPPLAGRYGGDRNGDCCVCLDRPKTALLLPCKHLCLCDECSKSWKPKQGVHRDCPICLQSVKKVVKGVFL